MKTSEDPTVQVVVNAENPWPGLDYFAEKSRAFFHGREAEADLLLSMVRHRLLTVLYGQSGLGKSSLLQAGLFPRLRADGWLPVYIRLSHTDADGLGGKGPTALIAQARQFIRDSITDAIEQKQLLAPKQENGASGTEESPMPHDNESLWAYLHRRVSGLRSATRERVAPVLVFDQFEEIFTLGRNETRQNIRQTFLRDLADCVENRLPQQVHEKMNLNQPSAADNFADLDLTRQDYRVVLSLREDYLAELHDLSDLMPSIHENETRLLPLNGWQALDAVAIPGEKLVEPIVAREIVEIVAASRRGEAEDGNGAVPTGSDGNVTDERDLEIDPALLSMVCRELNEERKRRKASKITPEITNDLLANRGRSILHRFYADCFHSLPDRASADEVQKFVEDELLTPAGYRNMAELVRAQNRLARSGVPDPPAAIQRLIDERLLRISERRQDKTKWLELTHDVLCNVVKESRQTRELREAKEQEEREERELATRRVEEAETQARQAREREAEAVARLKQMRRERRLVVAALALTICFAGSLCIGGFLLLGRLQTGRAAEQRSRGLVTRAKERLARENDDRRNVFALRLLGRAIRVDPGNNEAVKLACQLLMDKNWCLPISPLLHYSGSPVVAAGWSPDNREIVAVAQDGNLARWSAADFKELPPIPLVPDKMSPENKVVVTSAGFSRDAKLVLVTLFPSNKENARVLRWSDEEASYRPYRPKTVTVNFKETARSFAWSRDGNTLYIFPMRSDLLNCRIFKFEGSTFKEIGTVPNATAGDLSPDDQLLATAAPGGRIEIWDASSLGTPNPQRKATFEPDEPNPERRIFTLFFSDDGAELGATLLREPPRVWNMRDGKMKLLKPKSSQDQMLRLTFGPRVHGQRIIAGGVTGMVGTWDFDHLDQLRAEPMCLPDAFVYPTFSSDGNSLLSLSGGVWLALDSVRLWDVSLHKPPASGATPRFTGKSPPPWLPDLTEAVAGLRVAAEEEESPPATLSEIRKKYAGQPIPNEYLPLWNRYLASEGR
jgi:WD40 repeat protein